MDDKRVSGLYLRDAIFTKKDGMSAIQMPSLSWIRKHNNTTACIGISFSVNNESVKIILSYEGTTTVVGCKEVQTEEIIKEIIKGFGQSVSFC
jgi:hypothetical protein